MKTPTILRAVRPTLLPVLGVAFELGFDDTDSDFGGHDDASLGGWLTRLTLAPQIAAWRSFWGHPAIPAHFTYAFWADGVEGRVCGPPYANDTAGIGAGLQMESWW